MAARSSRRDPKARLKLTLPALAMVLLFIVGGAVLVVVDSASPGRIDATAAHRLNALCGTRSHCQVRLGDLIDGAWDSFYEFSSFVPQAEMNQVLGSGTVRTADLQRVLLLMVNGRVVRRQYAHTGQDQPLADSLDFPGIVPGAHPGWVTYTPSTVFGVSRCATAAGGPVLGQHGGTYYMLTPVALYAGSSAPCEPVRDLHPHTQPR